MDRRSTLIVHEESIIIKYVDPARSARAWADHHAAKAARTGEDRAPTPSETPGAVSWRGEKPTPPE